MVEWNGPSHARAALCAAQQISDMVPKKGEIIDAVFHINENIENAPDDCLTESVRRDIDEALPWISPIGAALDVKVQLECLRRALPVFDGNVEGARILQEEADAENM